MSTTNIQDMLDSAFAAGRVAERQMSDILKRLNVNPTPVPITATDVFDAATARIAKDKAAKAPTKSRAARTSTGPREKGVREKILALITSDVMSPMGIVAVTGFKNTSVRATLMSLKKSGLAMNDGGLWTAANRVDGGNGGTEAQADF